jgi:hypothetical protein
MPCAVQKIRFVDPCIHEVDIVDERSEQMTVGSLSKKLFLAVAAARKRLNVYLQPDSRPAVRACAQCSFANRAVGLHDSSGGLVNSCVRARVANL